MAIAITHTVHFQPVDIELSVDGNQTVLSAALQQGLMLRHGCRAGNCASCKAILLDGQVFTEPHSRFTLEEDEVRQGYILLCRTRPRSNLCIQLTSYDEDLLQERQVVQTYAMTVAAIEPLTHDIMRLVLVFDDPERHMPFRAGQYASIRIPGSEETRAFSMATTPQTRDRLEFLIKIIPHGRFSSLLAGGISVGDHLEVSGPYGAFYLRERLDGDILCIAGGSGMAPIWAMLNDMAERGIRRRVTFYYGARTRRDLFYLDQLGQLARQLPGFRFIPALSHPCSQEVWDGETGFITDVLTRTQAGMLASEQAYLCGPPPMIDAALRVLVSKGMDEGRIFYDKFTSTA
jgi:propane monooxygenase reductase subunit